MEDLNARLQLEVKKSGVFERKSAELECINDELRLENRILIAEVEELKAKISMSNYPLDDGGDETANSNLFPGTNPSSSVTDGLVLDSGAIKRGAETNLQANVSSNLVSNTNNSNMNMTEVLGLISDSREGKGSPGEVEIKVQPLHLTPVLEAELHDGTSKTTSYQAAFQEELDMRTKMEEKYESLRIRFDRLVEENDHMRTVLANHCINVPPHLPITGKRKVLSYPEPHHPFLHSHPPSFVPLGRARSSISSAVNFTTSSPSKDQTLPPSGNYSDKSSSCFMENERISQISFGDNEVSSESVLSVDGVNGDVTSLSGSRQSSSSTPSLSEDESMDHIVIQDQKTTPTLSAIHRIDTALLATTTEIQSAKCFYEHVRQKMKSDSEYD